MREAEEETRLSVSVSHLIGIYQCPQTCEGFGVVNLGFSSVLRGGVVTPSASPPVVGARRERRGRGKAETH